MAAERSTSNFPLAICPALAIVAVVGVMWPMSGALLAGPYSINYIADGTVIAIRNTHTGMYLSVSQEDGLVRAAASSKAAPDTHFRLVALSDTTASILQPAKVRRPRWSKNLCLCSGFVDDHGFGGYCHAWESESHRPWCYVDESCEGAKKGSKMRKHQGCSSETGYLGPEGWVAPPGCSCSGHESVHGFGSECKGWEFPGQTPWCYITPDSNCSSASGQAGSFESKHAECVRDVPPPPPQPPSSPPPLPSPPPPPSPPPAPWRENRDGWGTSSDCPCSGYNSSLGFGGYCKGWEFAGQTPWCYVSSSCPHVVASPVGSFGHAFLECMKAPSGIFGLPRRRRLKALADEKAAKREEKEAKKDVKRGKDQHKNEPTPLSQAVTAATGKKTTSKAGSKALADARAHGGVVTATSKMRAVIAKQALAAKTPPPPPHLPFDQEQARLRARARQLQRVALVSQATGGFLVAEPPPHKFELFLRGDEPDISHRAVFALPSGHKGPIIALGTGALLNLCTFKPTSPNEPLDGPGSVGVCTGQPTTLRKRLTARRGTGEHHRKLLLFPTKASEWMVEKVKA